MTPEESAAGHASVMAILGDASAQLAAEATQTVSAALGASSQQSASATDDGGKVYELAGKTVSKTCVRLLYLCQRYASDLSCP